MGHTAELGCEALGALVTRMDGQRSERAMATGRRRNIRQVVGDKHDSEPQQPRADERGMSARQRAKKRASAACRRERNRLFGGSNVRQVTGNPQRPCPKGWERGGGVAEHVTAATRPRFESNGSGGAWIPNHPRTLPLPPPPPPGGMDRALRNPDNPPTATAYAWPTGH